MKKKQEFKATLNIVTEYMDSFSAKA